MSGPKILAVETSGTACSVALLLDGRLTQRLAVEPRRHGELVLGMMDGLLAEAGIGVRGLDALAFGRGPGSFTGVRIAAAVVQGAAFGADLPVVPVSTLAALAEGQRRRYGHRRCLPALDARMGEVYWGCWSLEADGARAVCPEQVARPGAVHVPDGEGWHGVGSGWAVYREDLGRRLGGRLDSVDGDAICEAQDVASLAVFELAAGGAVGPERALPVYLRDRVTAALGSNSIAPAPHAPRTE